MIHGADYGTVTTAPDLPADDAELVYTDITRDPIPPRDWAVAERVPAGHVTLLSGEGAIGKSLLLLQLSAAHVLGRDWIGTLPTLGSALYMNCEDDDDEVCRRLEAIANHYGTTRNAMEADLHVLSFAGRDAVLGYADRTGRIRPTPLFEKLKHAAVSLRPKVLVSTPPPTYSPATKTTDPRPASSLPCRRLSPSKAALR